MSARTHLALWPITDLAARLHYLDAVVCTASLLPDHGAADSARDVLDQAERDRLAGYTNDVVAGRFSRGRALLRTMLGSALSLHPRDVALREGLHGKPHIARSSSRPLWFSVSHADDLLVVAMSRVSDVGVDVERLRVVDNWQRVANRVLDPQERRQLELAVAAGYEPSLAFLRHWCRVEAELKAIGCGIAGLESHRAGERPRGLRLTDLADLPIPDVLTREDERYQAALALCSPASLNERQMIAATAHTMMPVTSPATASTA